MRSVSVPNIIIWSGSDAGTQSAMTIQLHGLSHHLEQRDHEERLQGDTQHQQQQPQQDQPPTEEQDSRAVNSKDGAANQDTIADSGQDPDGNQAQDTTKKRCDKCGKKLGLTGGFPCRCGGTYCAVHRYSDRHECSFDYRQMGANQIRRDNPVVVASKLRKL
ncbi:zinc finger A20 and AN1 domain-containing stress-associated protein 6 [Drosophila sechellia]|uniref:GM11661 n=1 Tax=Drosophila sechellia TaxID=7238 RepID=B4INM7_DROSE|nr:zinc finger A20 and AN1 domain-containing stress-associated protein 6 [Drosophila sechellia]EDW51229.1 GM11661 [Drosophila sechellia]